MLDAESTVQRILWPAIFGFGRLLSVEGLEASQRDIARTLSYLMIFDAACSGHGNAWIERASWTEQPFTWKLFGL
ncbi:MAG: hypothetical protein ACREB1_05490, partial [Sphingomicrobium sp.]